MKRAIPTIGVVAVVQVFCLLAPSAFGAVAPRQSTTGPEPPLAVVVRDALKPEAPPIAVSTQVTLTVPGYLWRHGCGPTAVGMVIGYYDGQGYSVLIPGDASTQTSAVDQAIASGGDSSNPNPPGSEQHYEDYARPEDPLPGPLLDDDYITQSRTPHADDCIADYMDTSKSTRNSHYGSSWSNDIGPAFVSYVNQQSTAYYPTYERYHTSDGTLTWAVLTSQIDAGRPMVFLVDSDGDGDTDHFVTVVGYRDTPTQQYGCLDTWAPADVVRWEDFAAMAPGQPWGVWGGWSFLVSFPIYVDDDAPGDPGPGDPLISDPLEDGSAAHPYDAILEGINAAVAGDTVVVLDGTYTGSINRNLGFGGKAITVMSQNGPDVTIIDCQGSGRGFDFNSGETLASVVDGFTICGGSGYTSGGGMSCSSSSPTVMNCVFYANAATEDGGGMFNTASDPLVLGCTFEANTCTDSVNSDGGGMHNNSSSPILADCSFIRNTSRYGGGIYNYANSSPVLTDCRFVRNSVGYRGGGIYSNDGNTTLSSCAFTNNLADDLGGGIFHLAGVSPAATNCVFAGNSAVNGGGAIYCNSTNLAVTNCTIFNNRGVVRADGIFSEAGNLTITNCIVWGNDLEEIYVPSGTVTVDYSDVKGGWSGTGNIDADPLLTWDGHLTESSPCIDWCPTGPADDIDDEARPVDIWGVGNDGDDFYDIGCDEFIDADEDGLPDWWEALYYTDAFGDPDSDGLTNLEEYRYGTDPGNADTDGDGLNDYDEVYVYATDPLKPDDITDVYWASGSVVITFASAVGVSYELERADANAYADGLTWYVLPGDTLVGTVPQDTFTDNLSTNPLANDFRFYRVTRTDGTNTSRQTAAVFELNLTVSFAVRQFFVSTPLIPDPDHADVNDVLGAQLPYTGARIDKLIADSGLFVRATYTPGVGWANTFPIVAGESYWLNVGNAIPIPHKVRLTGYVPEEALAISVTRDSFAVTRRWMAYSMPRPTTLAGLGLPDAITPFWAPTNEVRLLPLGTTAWKRYFYSPTTQQWYVGSLGGPPAGGTPIVCGQGILFIHQGAPGQPDTLLLPTWYLYPPNTW